MEIRAQVAYHFKLDPAKLTPGSITLPQQLTRTVSVGEELFTEKVDRDILSHADCAALVEQLEIAAREANRTAKAIAPAAAKPAPEPAAEPEKKSILDIEPETEELSAF